MVVDFLRYDIESSTDSACVHHHLLEVGLVAVFLSLGLET